MLSLSCVMLVSSFLLLLVLSYFVFFKQKTAYELRISDWSSDVCSSDLGPQAAMGAVSPFIWGGLIVGFVLAMVTVFKSNWCNITAPKIGRASCRERVCQYV